jgi:hypothetical protein
VSKRPNWIARIISAPVAYKNHLIRSGAAPLPNGSAWKPIAQVNWSENGREHVMLWMEWYFDRTFPSPDAAEKEGHSFARQWIDDGKPKMTARIPL